LDFLALVCRERGGIAVGIAVLVRIKVLFAFHHDVVGRLAHRVQTIAFAIVHALMPIHSTLRIPFASAEHAQIAKQVIEVDAELQKHAVKRTLTTENETLVGYAHRLQITSVC
jgi:hypothetical protein